MWVKKNSSPPELEKENPHQTSEGNLHQNLAAPGNFRQNVFLIHPVFVLGGKVQQGIEQRIRQEVGLESQIQQIGIDGVEIVFFQLNPGIFQVVNFHF